MLNLGWVWCVKAVGVRCDMLLRGAISSVKFGYVTAVNKRQVGVWYVWLGCAQFSYVLLSSVKAVAFRLSGLFLGVLSSVKAVE